MVFLRRFVGSILVVLIICTLSFLSSKFNDSGTHRPIDSTTFFSQTPQDYILLGKKMDINTASIETLEALSGIGPSLAKEIVKYREAHGRFKNIAELTNVKGIGPKKLERIKSYVKVETRL